MKPEKTSLAEGGCESTWQVLQVSIELIKYTQYFCVGSAHIQAFHGNGVSVDTVKQKHPRIRARLAKLGFIDRGNRARRAAFIHCSPQIFLGLCLVLQKSLRFPHSCEISFILGSNLTASAPE